MDPSLENPLHRAQRERAEAFASHMRMEIALFNFERDWDKRQALRSFPSATVPKPSTRRLLMAAGMP